MAHPPPSADAERLAEERRLIASAQAGDATAFRLLVERHQSRAYALALRITRSSADAEEVAQDAFVKVWDALSCFRGDSSFSTWLHQIVARRAIDRAEVLQRRRRREAPQEAMGEPVAHSAAGGSPRGRAVATTHGGALVEGAESGRDAVLFRRAFGRTGGGG